MTSSNINIPNSSTHLKSILYQYTQVIIFGASDVDYLVKNLSVPQLRREITISYKCEKFFFDDHDIKNELVESDYQKACKLAIDIIRSEQPRQTTTQSKFVDIDSLKSSVDIVEIAERYTQLIKAGKNFKALCPFHSEKHPSFMVYPDKQSWHCFGACSTGGDAISLVMKAENVDFKSAIHILGGSI